ncbi:winged helix-turn-helix domain-containing protein [Marinicella rhabdoformis]|uniref:winged helix-turn-helix domain-containing protein n=1 Tax=Marinicella rhabdoformis TaxID=2580566 RepID=UPI0015D0565A|nr:winged helix-turn-helix domain-containing protein [Marinicella rhabdoformis]
MKFFRKNQFKIIKNKTYWNGKELLLSEKGHACLIIFLESKQQVISKEQLIKSLWHKVAVSDDSLFKVIQEIRKSLRQLGIQEDLIGNVYGKGYQWLQSEKPPHTKPWFIFPAFGLIIIAVSFFWAGNKTTPQITEQAFQQLVQQLKHGNKTVVTTQLTNSNHPLDQLRASYLTGYAYYQSGNYEQSIQQLEQGITKYGNNKTSTVLADSFLLLAKMYIYRDDKTTLKSYLAQALKHYQDIENPNGIFNTKIETARYHQAINEYPESINQLNEIYDEAKAVSNTKIQLRALANLAHSYEQTQQPEAAIKALEDTLELALSTSDGDYAAYAHGALSTKAMKSQNYNKAMKYAQAALQFSLSQHDTNQFQQSFSAFYLLLLPLGHIELADKYLDLALEIQNQFNSEGVLYHAEIQKIESLTIQHQHAESRERLKRLKTESLSQVEQQEVQALMAFNSHFLQDNINAYTKAKPILEDHNSSNKFRIYAGMAFVLAALELERTNEAKTAFQLLEQLPTSQDNTVYTAYLDMLTRVPKEWINPDSLQFDAKQFEQRMAHLQATTSPQSELLQTLDSYIQNITLN